MAEHKMTFEVENGITKAKIDGVYMGGGKAAQVEASEEQIKDVVEDTVKANPEMAGGEPNLEGLELSGDKYAIPQGSNIELVLVKKNSSTILTDEQVNKLLSRKAFLAIESANSYIIIPQYEYADSYAKFVFTDFHGQTNNLHIDYIFAYLNRTNNTVTIETDSKPISISINNPTGSGTLINGLKTLSIGFVDYVVQSIVTITKSGSTWSNSMSANEIFSTYYYAKTPVYICYTSNTNNTKIIHSALIYKAISQKIDNQYSYEFYLIGDSDIIWDSTLNLFIIQGV